MKSKRLILLLAMMASMGTLNAANYSGTCGPNLTWSLNTVDSTLTINGSGAMYNYVDQYSSSGNVAPWCGTYGSNIRYIKYVILPQGLTTIGEYAFYECNRIYSIDIPNSVTSIGKCAFGDCSKLISVDMSNNVTSIEWRTFMGCGKLTSFTIPNNVTSIGMEAFKYCGSLTSIELPSSVVSIGGDAFYGCSNIDSITLTENLTTIGQYAFADCNISSINFIGTMNTWCNKEWSPSQISKNYKLYINGILQENATIPNDVTNIGNWAFLYCSSLTSVTIPNSVENIERGAFMNCSKLVSVDIPNSLTSLAMQFFSGCSNLTSVTIPSSITSIGEEAFYGCGGLTSIYNYSVQPQTISNTYVFGGVKKSACTLYVPIESINLYKEANEWKEFNPILPISGTSIEDIHIDSDKPVKVLMDGQVYILRGEKVYDMEGKMTK